MTQLLKQVIPPVSFAIAQIKQLPETEQHRIALLILEELKEEIIWNQAFAKSHDVLAQLAAAALVEDKADKILELNPETSHNVKIEKTTYP